MNHTQLLFVIKRSKSPLGWLTILLEFHPWYLVPPQPGWRRRLSRWWAAPRPSTRRCTAWPGQGPSLGRGVGRGARAPPRPRTPPPRGATPAPSATRPPHPRRARGRWHQWAGPPGHWSQWGADIPRQRGAGTQRGRGSSSSQRWSRVLTTWCRAWRCLATRDWGRGPWAWPAAGADTRIKTVSFHQCPVSSLCRCYMIITRVPIPPSTRLREQLPRPGGRGRGCGGGAGLLLPWLLGPLGPVR